MTFSKIMRNCIGFALLCPDKYKKTPTFQSISWKIKLILTLSVAFSLLTHRLLVFTLTSHSHGWYDYFLFWWYPIINARLQSLSCPAWQVFLSPLIWGGGVRGHGAKASDKRWTSWLDRDGKSPPLPSPAPSMFAPFCPMLSLDSLIAHASPVSP